MVSNKWTLHSRVQSNKKTPDLPPPLSSGEHNPVGIVPVVPIMLMYEELLFFSHKRDTKGIPDLGGGEQRRILAEHRVRHVVQVDLLFDVLDLEGR